MPTYKPSKAKFLNALVDGQERRLLDKRTCDDFNASLLGLGDLSREAVETDAIAAVFDLQGFTNFGKQIEPHLSVPIYLSDFLSWLMQQIKTEMIRKMHPQGAELWSSLPFFVKFLGDGLLALWDASSMGPVNRTNVIVSMKMICTAYQTTFLPKIRRKVVDPPPVLRCGIARGKVYSVGDGNDYVGSCINMAARLQKYPGATFAFNRRGFDLEVNNDFFAKQIVVKKVSIRGIGENELIGVLKSEYDAMSPADKKEYGNP